MFELNPEATYTVGCFMINFCPPLLQFIAVIEKKVPSAKNCLQYSHLLQRRNGCPLSPASWLQLQITAISTFLLAPSDEYPASNQNTHIMILLFFKKIKCFKTTITFLLYHWNGWWVYSFYMRHHLVLCSIYTYIQGYMNLILKFWNNACTPRCGISYISAVMCNVSHVR